MPKIEGGCLSKPSPFSCQLFVRPKADKKAGSSLSPLNRSESAARIAPASDDGAIEFTGYKRAPSSKQTRRPSSRSHRRSLRPALREVSPQNLEVQEVIDLTKKSSAHHSARSEKSTHASSSGASIDSPKDIMVRIEAQHKVSLES